MVIAGWVAAGTFFISATSGRGDNLILSIAPIRNDVLLLRAIGHAGDVTLVCCALSAAT